MTWHAVKFECRWEQPLQIAAEISVSVTEVTLRGPATG